MTATRRDLRNALESMGRRPAPVPRPDFVAGLEARLMSMDRAAESQDAEDTGVAPVVPLHGRRGGKRVAVLTGAAAATIAALVLAGALSGWFGNGADGRNPQLTDAVDTTVKLPNGEVVQGEEGLLLPDGAVVRTGPDGTAAAGGVEIGPGQQATVEDGKLLPPVTAPTSPTVPPIEIPTIPTVPSLPGL